jgi:hypothetical protein
MLPKCATVKERFQETIVIVALWVVSQTSWLFVQIFKSIGFLELTIIISKSCTYPQLTQNHITSFTPC